MTGVPCGTALSFFDFFAAKTDADAKARTSAAANAASFPFFRCRVIFLKRRGDSRARRKATHVAATPLLLAFVREGTDRCYQLAGRFGYAPADRGIDSSAH